MDSTPLTPPSNPVQSFGIRAFLPILGIIVVLVGVVAATVLNQRSQDNRQQAATNTGTVTVSLKPGSQTLTPNTTQTVEIQTNTASDHVLGYELYLDFTGTVPSNLVFAPSAVTGLTTLAATTETTSTGKRVTIGAIAPIDPVTQQLKPFSTSGGIITLGRVTFSVPASGTMTATFTQLSKATRYNPDPNAPEADILKTPTVYRYDFGEASGGLGGSEPTPTITPRPTGTATPRPTATATPRPTATPTPVVATTVPTSVINDSTCAQVICRASTGCSCPSYCNFAITKYSWTCGGLKTATATPRPTATATPRPTATATPRPTATPTPGPTSAISDPTCAQVMCRLSAGCTCPTYCNFPQVPNGWTCGGLKTATATPRPTATATPRPTATPAPAPVGGLTQQQYNSLPLWVRRIIESFL